MSCGQSNNDKEAELIKKERELLQKEREFLEKEKSSNNKNNSKESSKVNKQKRQKAQEYQVPDDVHIIELVYPSETTIQKDLLNQSVKYKKISWTFYALSEYRDVRIVKQNSEGDYWEATVDMELEDYKNGRNYFLRLFVNYKYIDGVWYLQKFDPIDFYAR